MLLLKDFYFIRHGETEPHLDNLNISLNARGVAQIELAVPALADLWITEIFTSPLTRAIETTRILNAQLQLNIQIVPELSECSYQTWSHLISGNSTNDPDTTGFVSRVTTTIELILKKPGPVLIVAHGGVHYALCQYLNIKNHPWKMANGQLVYFRPMAGTLQASLISQSFHEKTFDI